MVVQELWLQSTLSVQQKHLRLRKQVKYIVGEYYTDNVLYQHIYVNIIFSLCSEKT